MLEWLDGGLVTRWHFVLAIAESSYVCSSDVRARSDRPANVAEKEARPGSGTMLAKFSVLHGNWKMWQNRDSAE
jgi:hypothetical protein